MMLWLLVDRLNFIWPLSYICPFLLPALLLDLTDLALAGALVINLDLGKEPYLVNDPDLLDLVSIDLVFFLLLPFSFSISLWLFL